MNCPRVRFAIAAGTAASFAAVALSIAAPPSDNATAYYFVGGHAFGVGEQQVYVIERHAQLTVRYRDFAGELRAKTYRHNVKKSLAMTIEGMNGLGGPVLGVATAGARVIPAAYGSSSPSNQPSPQSPPPSPALDQNGAANPRGVMSDLAPASIILSGIVSELPSIGKPWNSSGEVTLPFGSVAFNVSNIVSTPAGYQNSNVMQISSSGRSEVHAKVNVAGFGMAALRGAGSASGLSFVELQHKLLLGTSLLAASHGNANVKERRGDYDLRLTVTIKLVKYVPGVPVTSPGPGFVVASGYLGGGASPNSGVYSTSLPNRVAAPAATNTEFLPSPLPAVTPYQSALPEVSLPPVPIPIASDQPVASPPPGPTPTPTPTRY